jgi:hypothetical protein
MCPLAAFRQGHDGMTTKETAMSSKVSSGRNHNHSDSKQSGQQAPGSTPPGSRSGATSGGSQQSDAAGKAQKSDAGSGNKQSDSKAGKS